MIAKSKYKDWLEEDKLLLIHGWARDGLTNEDIAHNMGISRETLHQWSKKYACISDALKNGKEVSDIRVENALYKRAVGYKYDEITKEIDVKTGELRVTKVVTKQVIPDTTAQIFWLKNRRPDKWRDKQDVNANVEVEDLSALADLLK